MHVSSQATVDSPEAVELPELSRFREEWLAELERRKVEASGSPPVSSGANAISGSSQVTEGPLSPVRQNFARSPVVPAHSRTLPSSHPALNNHSFASSTILENALKIYRQAVEHEQRSELDQALLLYRQAFRLDDNVDRAYQREQMLKSILKAQQESTSQTSAEADAELNDADDQLSASFESAVTITPAKASAGPTVVTGTLATLLKGFPEELKFQPENENEPVLVNLLPEELLVMIIGKLGATSIERFACVNRKARVLTLDPVIWKGLVRSTYHPPQIPEAKYMVPLIKRFQSDYRRVYIEQPRVRTDGVYIAICHYVRAGLSENNWVNVCHLITYHRYLRFFPNGQVLSLLTNEEHSPKQVIPILKPTLRMKGLFFGHWKLVGTTVHLYDLFDASGRFVLPNFDTHSQFPSLSHPTGGDGVGPTSTHSGSGSSSSSGDQARYAFAMNLNLRSRPLGRWNKMDIESYDSVNIESGDVYPVALKHERPFWFSKVRSYA
ncbi:hypothetical protein B0H34DRAFT_703607 [Crassisporium funariophilum]|nr:hypothetical protein B0H34DRAFT_703607 [Crassisporium funariophilum]